MARKRMLDPSIWTDDGMAELTPRQQLLYIGLISNADDDGRLKGNASAIRLMLPGVYGEVSNTEIESDIEAVLANMRKLRRYYVDTRPYLVFDNYRTWQVIQKPKPSVLPDPVNADSYTDTVPVQDQYENGTQPLSPNRTERNRTEEKRKRGASDKPPRTRTQQNELWDAFRDTLGTEPRTKTERGKWNGALKELEDAEVEPAHIPDLVKSYRKVYGDIDCNPRAIANNLSALMTRNGVRGSPKPRTDVTELHEYARQNKIGRYAHEEG